MKSALYVGTVRHRRFTPIEHTFRYRIFYAYLDLAELPDGVRVQVVPGVVSHQDQISPLRA